MRAVIDTVVFVRALINPKGEWGRLLFELSDRYTLVLSPEIIAEILEVIYRPTVRRKLRRLAAPPRFEAVLSMLEEAEVVEPGEKMSVCRDPDDNKVFECAVAGAADYIVSEDNDILAVGECRGTKTISAAEFMRILGTG